MAYSSAVPVSTLDISRAGRVVTALPTTPDGTNGNKFLFDRRSFLYVENGSGAQITVTIETPYTVDGQAISDLTINVAAGARVMIGPFTKAFEQADGYVWAQFSSVTSVTIGVYRLP